MVKSSSDTCPRELYPQGLSYLFLRSLAVAIGFPKSAYTACRGGQRPGPHRPDLQMLRRFNDSAKCDFIRPIKRSHCHLLCYHPRCFRVQSIEALARVLKIEALLNDIHILQSIQGVSNGSGRQICFGNDIFLSQKAP